MRLPSIRAVRRAAGMFLVGVLLSFLVTPVGAAQGASATVVRVTDFGADPTGRSDSAAAVAAALKHAKSVDGPVRVLFPHGTYQLYPEQAESRELYISNTAGADQRYRNKRIGLLIEDMKDVVIDGDGSHLQFHGLMSAFAVIRSQHVTATNFSFDYTTPKVIDATVAETGTANGRAYRILDLPPGTLYRVADNHVTWLGETSPTTGQPYWSGVDKMQYTQTHDPKTQRTWRGPRPLFENVAAVTDLGDKRIRIDYQSSTAPSDRGLVYQMRQTDRDTAGGLIWESSDVTLRGIAARYLHGFGIVGQLSENITIDGNEFRTDPATGRTTASFADFIQMSGVKGAVTITNNIFDGPHDDPINIHGTYLQVTQRLAPDTLVLSYMHNETAGFPQFHPGDQVEITDKRTMAVVPGGTATVRSVDGPSGQDHDKSLTNMTVTFDRAIPDVVTAGGFVVENTTYTPSARITGNTFRNVPTRGILVTTRRPVVIEDNVFDGMAMSSISIGADGYQWYESGPVRDVLIRRNTFLRPSSPVIFVDPTNQVLDPANPVHQGIHVEHNDFRIGNVQLVNAKSVRDITFLGNDVKRLDRDQLVAVRAENPCPAVGATTPVRASATKGPNTSSLFRFRGSSDVLIQDNKYDNGLNLRGDLEATQADQVTVDGDDIRFGQDNILPVVQAPKFRSSKPEVLRVAPDGTATAVAAGTAEVTAIVKTETGQLVSRPLTMTVGGDPASPECDRTAYVSELPFAAESNGWGPVERDTSNGENSGGDGNPLQIGGTRFDKGLGVHAASSVSVQLDGRYKRFISQVGVDDEVGNNGSVAFEVVADGKVIATTPVMTGNDPARTIDVDVTSVRELTLRVTDGGNGNSSDHADWADARLVPTD
ncbi:NPCBM/NEW2 domain-containing protein [Streptomyces sp. NBC_01320]|uniref:NPCBM/NEW2 domain-containing protein n=1 Tax=Streptomyces sp. NBC_01320 TaxID=2903824 RepID=UPI002E12EEC1|nr:NPCBM/NEW2 domain-containing protein [Streptomyces sp. NBC_01320]